MPFSTEIIAEAHVVWSKWVEAEVVRPQDYDRDLADAIAKILTSGSRNSLQLNLQKNSTPALDLIRATIESMRPFGRMLSDLFELYCQIGARTKLGDSLRIQIGPNDGLDETLESFREMNETIESVVGKGRSLVSESDWLWSLPLRRRTQASGNEYDQLPPSIRKWVSSYEGNDYSYETAVPCPPMTGLARLDKVVAAVVDVLQAYRRNLVCIAPTLSALTTIWIENHGNANEVVHETGAVLTSAAFFSATDHWLLSGAVAAHQVVTDYHSGSLTDDEIDLAINATNEWLSSLPLHHSYTDEWVRKVTDLLSLPAWGKRHEVYSAWIVTQLNVALPQNRLQFIVNDGVFSMPFKPTHLADMTSAKGIVELWSELKSAITKPVGHGRKSMIQPDYRFVQTSRQNYNDLTASANPVVDTILAVEVKQYLKAAKKNPGQALADYTTGLPNAKVFLAAHGPVSLNVLEYVPIGNHSRAQIFRDVRPLQAGAISFTNAVSTELTRLAPPDNGPPKGQSRLTTVSVVWKKSVHDLDLYVSQGKSWSNELTICYHSPTKSFGRLVEDAFDGGPECVELFEAIEETRVVVHSHGSIPLVEAQPKVIITGNGFQSTIELPADFPSAAITWHAATMGAGSSGTVQQGSGAVRLF